jgi:uncharacterized protein YfaP (DUF2135 family)
MFCKSGTISYQIIMRNFLASVIFITGLSACGGSSEGGGANLQPQNLPPTANAGTVKSVDENSEVTLAGSGTDSDGTIVSYRWVQTSGTTVILQNSDTSTATFQAPEVTADEQLLFELTVTDDTGESATDSVQITLLDVASVNQPLSANAGTDQSIDENSEVIMTGSGTGSNSTIVSYRWVQTNGITVTLQNDDTSTVTFQAPEVTVDEQLLFELTLTDDTGESATDSVQITIIANQSPLANAGESQEVLEYNVVTLDGSASADSDGSISSYHWEQISNGAAILTMSNTTNVSVSFELPELTNNVEFAFRLTVTDDDGDTAQDDVLVTGRPTPGVAVSDVSGNTASLNSAAEFSVQLISQPSFNVSIPISSSDESEGIPQQSELTFTPENWQQAQTVVVRGTNENVQNGEQAFQIILGSATSSDVFYNGINPIDANLKGIVLSISQPETLNQLISGSESTLQPLVTYTGNNQLSFSLTESPEGMNIDLSTGKVTWTPQLSDEGQSYDINISVNDGNRFLATSFLVSVAAPVPVITEIEGNTLSVVDSSTTLNGMTITTKASQSMAEIAILASNSTTELSVIELAKLPVSSVPAIPNWIAPLTDVFVVREKLEGSVEVRFPITALPENVSLSDISLYDYSGVIGIEGKSFWSPVAIDIDFEGTIDSPVIVIELSGLGGMAFLGYVSPQAQSTNSLAPSSFNKATRQQRSVSAAASVDSVSCEQQFALGVALDKYVCTSSSDAEIEITIGGFGSQQTRWDEVKKEELVSWLIHAQEKFSDSSLGFDKIIKVSIHPMDGLGFVKPNENFQVLHITDDNSTATDLIKATAVHEYFHHAQAHNDTNIASTDLLIGGNFSQILWLIEGTAQWFEDTVYDSLDSYNYTENPGLRIAEVGINAGSGNDERRPYQRFSFIKLLDSSCSNFATDLRVVFNVDLANDPSGIRNMSDSFDSWSCNFGAHLGSSNTSSLGAALTYYNYATQFEGKLSLLDSNEPDTFSFNKPNYQFNQTWLNSISDWLNLTDDNVYKLNSVSNITSAGAYSFKVPAISGELPEGKVAELVVESNQEVIVSVTSEDSDFVGTNTIGTHQHAWFSTINQTSYIYEANGKMPELFVTLVNPSLNGNANVDVYFKIRDELDVDTIITSHESGEQVSNRVVTIAGNIPEEALESTNKVTVTVNGIATDTLLSSDGSFVVDVIVTLGDNIIKAQGFNSSTPVTNEEIITIQGVESILTGPNALIASRIVFVLRWDTNSTDLDIYSTDKNGGTIWYSDKTEGPGNLDYDNVMGFGPEVVSYRSTNDDFYINGTFNVDVHYYDGSPSTNYTLDIVLNETDSDNRRLLKYESIVPHTQSNITQDNPSGTGASRFNDILTVSCSSQRICYLAEVDTAKLAQFGSASTQNRSIENDATVRLMTKRTSSSSIVPEHISKNESAYTQCMAEFETYTSKAGTVSWTCNQDGTKLWLMMR